MKKLIRMRILARTALLSWSVAVLSVAAFAFFVIPLQRQMLLESLASKARVMSTSIQDITAGALVSEDYGAVVDHCTEILRGDSSVRFIVIVRKDGFALVHLPEGWHSEQFDGAWLPANRQPGWELARLSVSPESVFAYRNPLNYSAIEWGWVHVGLSLDNYHQSLQAMRLRTLWAGALCALLGLIIAIFYARRLVRPLLILRDRVQQLAAGDLSARAHISSGDEVEHLADSFNRMAESLQGSHQKLQEANVYTTGILSSMNDALLVVDQNCRILSVNPALLRLLSCADFNPVGHHVEELIPGGLGDLTQAGPETSVERTLLNHQGEEIPVLFSASLMRVEGGAEPRWVCVAVDLRERKRAEAQRRQRDLRLRRQNEVLAQLALLKELHQGDLSGIAHHVVEAAAVATGCPRTSFWLLSDNGLSLNCADQYLLLTQQHDSDMSMRVADYPRYFAAIGQSRVLAAHTARTDDRTSEFNESYMIPLHIYSMLDAPIKVGGIVVGVLCLEQTDAPRTWTEDEQQFVGSLADMAALAMEARDRRLAEELLRKRDAMLEATRYAAERFLHTDALKDCIHDVLARIGRALNVSRVYLFENSARADGAVITSQKFEWVARGITPQLNNPALQDFCYADSSFARWAERLARGDNIECIVSNLPPGERGLLEAQQIKSLIQVPIIINGLWWGFVGFDDCLTERQWQTADVDSLRAVAENLGSAIQRQRAQADILRAKEAAEAASRAKSQFLANMSHEIRTPINGVVGMLKLLETTPLQAKQINYVQNAIASSDALLTVINDILDFSKIEAGRMELDQAPLDLRQVVESALVMFQERAVLKKLELVSTLADTVPELLMGDANRIRQILINFLSNAIKFTERGRIELKVGAREAGANMVQLHMAVHDTGVGMSASVLQGLFAPFYQGDTTTTRRYGGTGLGLAICKQLAELMGGRIRVESQPGHGSTFMLDLTLPKAKPTALHDGPAVADLRALRVLLIEDQPAEQERLATQLRAWRCVFAIAADLAGAEQQLSNAQASGQPFQVILLSAQLQNGRGEAIGMALTRGVHAPATAIVFMGPGDRLQGSDVRGPFHRHLTQPVRQSELYNTLLALAQEPARPPAQPTDDVTVTSEPAVTRAHILVAEDNEINRMVAQEVIRLNGFECTCVEDGQGAVEAVRSGRYDLVLMDCQMPVLDGYEATRTIRAEERQRHGMGNPAPRLPIIALTAHAMKGDREVCLAAGMDDYMTKPLDPEHVKAMIERWLKAKQEMAASEPVPAPAPIAAPPPQESAPVVFDANALLKRCMGRADLARRLLEQFTKQGERDVQALLAAAQQNEVAQVQALAHRIKGAAANVSALTLRQRAADVESEARTRQVVAGPDHLRGLENAWSAFENVSAGWLGQMSAPSA